MIRYFITCTLALGMFVVPAFSKIEVDSRTAVFIDRREPEPLQLAVKDLTSDLHKVFGHAPVVIHNPAEATPVTIWVAYQYGLPKSVPKPAGWERLRIQTVRSPWRGSPCHEAVVLTGSDVLGAIYAVYQFSQQFLGVDPLYWWTDHPPTPKAEVSVPDNYMETQAPAFHYRGFFINDEDLLTGWRSGIPDGSDISLKTWNRVYEAILRLKGNMVIPGTWIFPYEPQIKEAEERGLFITQHHVNVLGLDTYRWPSNKPYSFITHPQLLEDAWKKSIEQYPPHAKIIWSVGYRGKNDEPFWVVDKGAPKSMAARAHVIQGAVDEEVHILRRIHPHAQIVFNAWMEGARFYREGLLKLPPEVTLVWADDGHGIVQDRGDLKAGEGIYYHVAMIDGRSNHFTEGVPLERIRRQLGRAARIGATRYLIVNTSNLRPVVMTAHAVMDLAWDPKPWIATRSDEAVVYLHNWYREEFGRKAADALVKYYNAYIAAPGKYAKSPGARMGDQFYQTMSRFIIVRLSEGKTAMPKFFRRAPGMPATLAQFASSIESQCAQAAPRWSKALRLAEAARSLVLPSRRLFYQANVLTQVDINLHGNLMLLDVAKAVDAKSTAERIPLIQRARQQDEDVEDALHDADYGKWKGFYTDGDWLENIPLTMNLETGYLSQLKGHGMPENTLIRAADFGFAYHMITAYQGTQHVRF